MRSSVATLIAVLCWSLLSGQQAAPDSAQIEQRSKEWLANLYDYGIMASEDSILITDEVQRILADQKLQAILYPDEYTWEMTVALLQQMQVKMAFWYFINLYHEYPDLCMKSILHYDNLFEADHILLASYYTYAFADPAVCKVENGSPVITRPDLVEEKLYTVREIIQKIETYRVNSGAEVMGK